MNDLQPLVELAKLVFFLGGTGALVTAAFAIHRFMNVALMKLDAVTESVQALNSNLSSVVESIGFIKGRVA